MPPVDEKDQPGSCSSEDESLFNLKNRQTPQQLKHQQSKTALSGDVTISESKKTPQHAATNIPSTNIECKPQAIVDTQSSPQSFSKKPTKSKSSTLVANTPSSSATPGAHRTRSSSKLNTPSQQQNNDSSSTTSSQISSDDDNHNKQQVIVAAAAAAAAAAASTVTTRDKQQQPSPVKAIGSSRVTTPVASPSKHQLTPKSATNTDLPPFTSQLSVKENKLSVYDLDNDDAELTKNNSVFDLGESGSEDKGGKLKVGSPIKKVFTFVSVIKIALKYLGLKMF
jgi:hypothetical protein